MFGCIQYPIQRLSNRGAPAADEKPCRHDILIPKADTSHGKNVP
jgi:hypothetical protein